MKKIAVLTATRAEYGLLNPIIDKLIKSGDFDVPVVVTGAHLSPEFGLTYKEIKKDGIKIHKKIEILAESDKPEDISKCMGNALIKFAGYFSEYTPDALIVLGDRYETLAVCIAAFNQRIPIFHLHGGEITEGAVDDAFRHSITKLSYLHFTSTEEYRKRVIQLGEPPDRVFSVGAVGVENALTKKLLDKSALETELNITLTDNYAVVTFHPVTLEENSAENQCTELLDALSLHPELNYIITKANADSGGRIINKLLENYCNSHENAHLFDSLGMIRYLSAVKYASMVIGNSSSGIIEVPSFKIPTINIGDRQKGRIKAASVIDCSPDKDSINEAMIKALSDDFKEICATVTNPYGNGNTSEKIVSIIKEHMKNSIDLKKKFFDIKNIPD